MKNECIISATGDTVLEFLKITLPQNIKFFDRIIIITDSKSINIQEFCKQHPITLLITDDFYKNGAKFNRGLTYNMAFELLIHKDQITLMDADCYTPDSLGKIIKERNFDIERFYGCRRIIIPKYHDFLKIISGDIKSIDKIECPFGIGYGFFQSFNYNSQIVKKYGLNYPQSYDNSGEDWQWRNLWGETINGDKEYTGLLTEIPEKIYHLGEPNINGSKNFFLVKN